MTLQPHQQRVVDEHAELGQRLNKLSAFIDTPPYEALPVAEQVRLRIQRMHMRAYFDVLGERIAAFGD